MNNDKYVERIDVLTGCANLLAFLETFSARLVLEDTAAFSLLVIDLNYFMAFNNQHGQSRGDSVLHWVGIILQDTGLPAYRIGNDEFLLSFQTEDREQSELIARSVFERFNHESKQFEIINPVSAILIHFE